MPLPRNVYDADLDVDGQVVELRGITLTHGDELRAELEGHKRSLPQLGHTFTSLMLWSACVRLGHYTGDYNTFRNGGLVEYRRIPQDELAGSPTVDPTPAEPSGSASSSPATSPDSSTGSTPTSTTA
jgi:hypothetical protein